MTAGNMKQVSFIPISPAQRIVVVSGGWLILLTVLSLAVVEASPASTVARFAYAGKVLLLLTPLAVLRREGFWLHPLVVVGIWGFAFGALPEASLVIAGLDHHTALPGQPLQVVTSMLDYKFVLECVALSCTYIGFYFSGQIPPVRLRHRAPRLVNLKLLFLVLISFAAFVVLLQAAGGVEALALERGLDREERVLAKIGGGHWHFLTAMAGPVVVTAAALMRRPLRSPMFWAALVFALSSRFIVTGSRGGTLVTLVLVYVVLVARRGRIPAGRAFVLVVAILVTIGLMTEFREKSRKLESLDEFKVESRAEDLVVKALSVFGRYSAVNLDIAIYARVPESSPLQLGGTYLRVLAAPVPRAVWADKPPGVGTLATETFIPDLADIKGVPASAVGEAFWNFHVVGVVVVFLLWGVFLQFIWKSVATTRMPGALVLYVITIFYLSPYSDAVYKWLHFIVPAIIALAVFCLPPLSVYRLPQERMRNR